ncbi:uncharacterized protein LOC122863019 isoform X2 [Siniperca chuatsi]|uniref:uncharacterized protein LOC122863019 isoform X2 n=1 Tax=Siniperca chuatsi TaxID=119488 RepID=UPI001CE117DC|nr:uncharacterized protein LOC122863019 isoform X2 [Siniperca chuatsi]
MPWSNTGYRPLRDMDQAAVSWKKFFVSLAGTTNGAHLSFVAKLKGAGQTEVSTREVSDYVLVFCPITSRVGTDISEALDNFPVGKPAILVVMHHTFNSDHVVAESRRLVNNPNVHLTVDCLFYEDRLLECNHNDIALLDIKNFLGVSASQVSKWQTCYDWSRNHSVALGGFCVGVVTVMVTAANKVPFWQTCKNIWDLSWKKFFVSLAGTTNGAHQSFVAKLKGAGQTEVSSPEVSDYVLVFCPIASRVGIDISEALDNFPVGKPAILVVMHHTFNSDHVVAESRRLVNNPNVHLTVDCLFYEGRLLECNRNDIALLDIKNFLGVSASQVMTRFTDLIQSGLHTINAECTDIVILRDTGSSLWSTSEMMHMMQFHY